MSVAEADRQITTVLVDEQALFRLGMRELLEPRGIEVVGEAATAAAGLALVERHAPDVAIVDLDLPDVAGFEAIRRIAALAPATHVLVLTDCASETDVTGAVLAGGSCYLLKDAPVETIVAGVRAAAAGEAMISPRLGPTLLNRLRATGARTRPTPEAALSERETEVLRLVARGQENDAIARELYISPHTVKNHISNILLKLQVANRIQAAVRAVREELV